MMQSLEFGVLKSYLNSTAACKLNSSATSANYNHLYQDVVHQSIFLAFRNY